MDPVIKSFEGWSNPILGPDDGVPDYVMLYVRSASPARRGPDLSRTGGWCDGKVYPIKQGDTVLVPPNAEHRFANTGAEMLSPVTVNPLSSVGG
ncbi:MAG: cupin domain-containing protein [Chloroflexi bacterium]|nr:cupin domain-containing protein [Chloroflexota bacterium]